MRMRANNILVDPEMWTEAKRGSIHIPKGAQAAAFGRGTVKAVGPGIWTQSGKQLPPEVEIGDRVLYYKSGAVNLDVDGREMHVIQEPGIIAVLDFTDFEDPIDTTKFEVVENTDNKENTDVNE